ncbi:MAG TPA: ATP phosphoribosyltransferase [Chloroflexota bacterium]|nr:ATP phosphoribosyltransferase [Chloroflexota bacterium]
MAKATRPGASEDLRLALPSKGMEDATLNFLAACGMSVDRSNPRQYRAALRTPAGVTVIFQRAADIFEKVDEGSVDLGITGYDIVREHEHEDDAVEVLYPELGYGRCQLVLAVPDAWLDVKSIADLAEVATQLRAKGSELRVATKYANLTRQFLYQHGINYFNIVSSQGALEAAPTMGYGDIVADLMTSGVTLRENRLKTVAGGTILRSEACLIGNRRALAASEAKLQRTRAIVELIEAYLRGRNYASITANVSGESEEAVARRITAHETSAGLRGPTIARVYSKVGGDLPWFAVTIIARRDQLLPAVEQLRKAGAVDMTVQDLHYVFEHRSWHFEALQRQLGGARVQGAGARERTASSVASAAAASELPTVVSS